MKRFVVGTISFLMLAFLALPALHAGASVGTTRVVDDDGMAVPGNCDDSTPTFSTIQAAVDASSAGDTVQVCPGVYHESVLVDKTLTLHRAQSGVDGRTRSA